MGRRQLRGPRPAPRARRGWAAAGSSRQARDAGWVCGAWRREVGVPAALLQRPVLSCSPCSPRLFSLVQQQLQQQQQQQLVRPGSTSFEPTVRNLQLATGKVDGYRHAIKVRCAGCQSQQLFDCQRQCPAHPPCLPGLAGWLAVA